MKTLQQYLDEADEKFNPPVVGDNFAIEIDDVLIESYIVDIAKDGYVIAADDRVLELLEHCGCAEEQDLQEQERLMEIPQELEEAQEDVKEDSLAGILKAAGLPARKVAEGFAPMEFAPLDEVSVDLAKRARDQAEYFVDMDYDDMRDRPEGYSEKQRSRFQRYIDRKEPRAPGDRDWDPVAEGVEIVDQDYDMDQQIFTLNVDGKRVSFTYWDYDQNWANPDIREIYSQVKERLQGLSKEQQKSVAKAVYRAVKQDAVKEDRQTQSEGEATLAKIAVSGDAGYKMIYDGLNGLMGKEAQIMLQDMYDDVSRQHRLHPDDNYEEILDRMMDNIEADYGQRSMDEAKYQGREVPLGKPMKGDVKKSKVYVRGPKGNVVKVNFGDKTMRIKKNIPGRRKNFRARHNCDNPGPRHKARYWSCRAW